MFELFLDFPYSCALAPLTPNFNVGRDIWFWRIPLGPQKYFPNTEIRGSGGRGVGTQITTKQKGVNTILIYSSHPW